MRRTRLIELVATLALVAVLVAASATWLYRKRLEENLADAALRGDVPRLRALLSQGVNPNARAVFVDYTPLMWAASERHPEAVAALIEAGADVNARMKEGLTALGVTVVGAELRPSASLATAVPLLSHGADIDAVGPYGMTPRRWATRWRSALAKQPDVLRKRAKQFCGVSKQPRMFALELGSVPPEKLDRDIRALVEAILSR